jgi:hypothetical protein
MNPQDLETKIELQMRTLRILWFALCMSIVFYFIVTLIVERAPDLGPNNVLLYVLVGTSVTTTLQSFLIKKALLNRAFAQQQVQMVQQSYIVTWAVTEVGALLGLVIFFTTNSPYYFLPMVVSLLGQLLHFPRRDHVINATFKNTM